MSWESTTASQAVFGKRRLQPSRCTPSLAVRARLPSRHTLRSLMSSRGWPRLPQQLNDRAAPSESSLERAPLRPGCQWASPTRSSCRAARSPAARRAALSRRPVKARATGMRPEPSQGFTHDSREAGPAPLPPGGITAAGRAGEPGCTSTGRRSRCMRTKSTASSSSRCSRAASACTACAVIGHRDSEELITHGSRS